jgi:hypothetical protein
MWAGMLVAALAVTDVAVDSPSPPAPCPNQAELDAELTRVGAIGVMAPEIAVAGDKMRVTLRGGDGSAVGIRDVDAPASCRERATVAAVLVASWMGIWPAGTKPASATENPTKPTGNVPSPTESPPVSVAASGTSDGEGRRKIELGLALVAALDGNGAAAGIDVQGAVSLAGPLRGFLALTASTEREQKLGVARAAYLRPALEAGLGMRLGRGPLQGDLGVSGRLGVLIDRGKDLPATHVNARVVPGAAANLRLVIAGRQFSPFAVAGAAYWFGHQKLILDNDPSSAELPSWDFTAGIGFFWAVH